jgi:hypothetical protein
MTRMPEFYRDLGKPEIERLARAICLKRGIDPDQMIPESGYPGCASIPAWWKYQDRALDFIAMTEATP